MTNTQATSAGAKATPARSDRSMLGIWKPMLAFIFLTFAIVVGGFFVFQHYRDIIKKERQDELGGIAKLKIGQISNWMSERRGDAQTLKDDTLFGSAAGEWLQRDGTTGDSETKLRARLSSIQHAYAAYGYTSISLFDTKGMLRLSSAANEEPVQVQEKESLLESMRSGQITFSDIHREQLNGTECVEIELIAPLTQLKHGKVHSIGAVLFRISPESFLFPLIQNWPTSSASAENILVRREGDEVVFLNELRHFKNSPLAMRIPLSQSQLPAAKAVKEQEGLVEGTDYRGVPVVGVLNKIPGTSWAMVSKIDQAEIYAPIHELTNCMMLLMLTLVSTSGVLFSYWRQKEKKQYEGELERQALVVHLDYLTRHSNDIIILMDDTGQIIDFNNRALEAYGYSAEDFIALHKSDLRVIDFTRSFSEQLAEINRAGSLRFESTHLRRNGEHFPVEVTVNVIEVAGKIFHQAIVRDLTERKLAEANLENERIRLRTLIQTIPDLVWLKDADGIFLSCNLQMERLYGAKESNIIGKTDYDFVDVKLADGFRLKDLEAIAADKPCINEEWVTFPDNGQRVLLETIKTPMRDTEGKLIGVMGIARDITERMSAEMQLAESYKELQRLTMHLENVRTDERAKIALNLHDEMGATLAALKMRVAWLASKLPADLPLLSAEAVQINELISGGIHTMHHVVNQLRPDLLGHVGLAEAIKDYVQKFLARTNIECILSMPNEEFELNTNQSLTIFRILQESLNNVVKHARASKVSILFSVLDQTVKMDVMDDGIGFDVDMQQRHCHGLVGIRERALMVGGKVSISSTPGEGSCVSVSIPPSPHTKLSERA